MEINCYPKRMGEIVRKERKQRKMNQVEFYQFLYPNEEKEDENIKKYMNSIENGKKANVDFDFLEVFCRKCDLSMDYIFGIIPYKKYEIKDVCEYTGLDENTVEKLHKWSVSSRYDVDMSILDQAFYSPSEDEKYYKAYSKREGIKFLKIINYLFREGTRKEKRGNNPFEKKYSNLSVLHSIYLMTMEKPVCISGRIANEEIENRFIQDYISGEYIHLDASDTLSMIDSQGVLYPIKPKEILKQIARNHLMQSVDRMIEQIQKEEK